jgi:ferredoxin
MRIVVDVDLCQRHGECAMEAPEVFALGDDGPVRVLVEDPPVKLHAKVADALRYCPTGAISITNE